MKQMRLVRLEAEGDGYVTDGQIVGKSVTCLEDVVGTFREVSKEDGEALKAELDAQREAQRAARKESEGEG